MPVVVQGFSPFTAAGNICEVDVLCRWLIKKPDTAHTLLRKCTDFNKKVIDCFVEKFPNYPIMLFDGEPTAANQIISPRQFWEKIGGTDQSAEESRGAANRFNLVCSFHSGGVWVADPDHDLAPHHQVYYPYRWRPQ